MFKWLFNILIFATNIRVTPITGVPQGSVLWCAPGIGPRSGPVPHLHKRSADNIRSSVRLLVDDCVLHKNIHSLQDCLTLQEDLTSLGQWEADWQMKFNVAKCHSMRVTQHQHHKQILFDCSLHNQTLENVQPAKYLGITITDNMDWGQHVSEISSKATQTLGSFAGIWLLHLGVQRKLHTKLWFGLN